MSNENYPLITRSFKVADLYYTKSIMENSSNPKLQETTMRLLFFVLVCFILIYAKTLLVPFAWALMISLASAGFVGWIKEKTKLPYSLIVTLYMIVLFAAIGGILVFFAIELQVLLSDTAMMQDKLSIIMHDLSDEFRSVGFNIPDHYEPAYFKSILKEHDSDIMNMVSGLGSNLGNFFLIMIYTFFLLLSKDLMIRFAESRFENDEAREKFSKLNKQILEISQQYIVGTFLMGFIVFVLSYLVFLAFGIKASLFFAIFFGILSLIPVIGVPLGMVVIALFAALTKDSISTAIYISIALFILNFLQDNVFRPMLMGSKLAVNAFSVFFFVILGGFFWGISGMILFIPVASILKIILDRSEPGSHFSIFLSELPKPEKTGRKYFRLRKRE
jgi:predicted PurR-regulated permease PerM